MILKAFLIVAMAIVAAAISMEVRGWKRGARMISRRQKGYRIAAATLLEIILAMILASRIVTLNKGPVFELSYWAAATGFACGLMVIALLDLREALKTYERGAKDNVRRLIEGEGNRQ